MTTSEKAAEKLKNRLVQRCIDAGLGYRITGHPAESGSAILNMQLDKKRPGDEVLVSNGISFLLDPADASLFKDCELDYIDGPDGGFYLKDKNRATDSNRVLKSEKT